jgi:hypothetical protein
VVEAVGEGVKKVKQGDSVYTARTLTGAYAEYALALEEQAATMIVFLLPETSKSGSPARNLFQLATGPVRGEGRLGDTAGSYLLRLCVCSEIDRSQSCIPMSSIAETTDKAFRGTSLIG